MRFASNRPGFALPFALLVIGFLTVGAATAFSRVDSETRVARSREAAADAFALAQTGLERFAVDRFNLGFQVQPPPASESTRIMLAGGYADVISRLVRPKTPTSQATYVIKSRGVRQAGSLSWTPPATHTVGQYAFFREGEIQVLSGWTSLSGLRKSGGSGTISGYDYCGVKPPVAGVALPDGTYVQNGGQLVPEGSPDFMYMGTQTQMASQIKIDWDGIINHNAIVPDVTINCTGGTCTPAFPTFTDPNYWPVVLVQGNYSVPWSGRGTLIVSGNLVINGSDQWRGIVLAGGTITSNGTNTVLGATISGLNVLLNQTVPINDVGDGTKTFQYDSCAIEKAVTRFSSLVLIPNTWIDNWSSW